MTIRVTRGDIVDVDLDGAIGAEKKNDECADGRPCVVIQNDVGNRFSPTTIVAPLTDAGRKKLLPTHVRVSVRDLGFPGAKPSIVSCEHIRSIDNVRIKNSRGRLSAEAMQRVDQAVAISVGLISLNAKISN